MKCRKFLAVVLSLLMLMAPSLVVSAADTVEPGQTGIVTFSIGGVYGVDGSFSFTNGDIITGTSYSCSGMIGSVENDLAYFYGANQSTLYVTVAVTVSADAQPGDQIEVAFDYETSDEKGNMSEWQRETDYIVVVAPQGGDDEGGGNEGGDEGGNEGGGATEDPAPVTPTPTPVTPKPDPKPVTPAKPVVKIDYTELNRQIETAESLEQGDYTKESWQNLEKALATAIGARQSKDQSVVDEAAEALELAIKQLVPADYSKLKAAIAEGTELAENDEIGNLWLALFNAMEDGNGLIGSGDQKAVDEATAEILDLIEKIKAAVAEKNVVKTETVVKEVMVEVEPEGEYCNIPMHRIWPILFFVSLAVNVALIVVIVTVVTKRKKNQKDDTPLVDYQIGDDE